MTTRPNDTWRAAERRRVPVQSDATYPAGGTIEWWEHCAAWHFYSKTHPDLGGPHRIEKLGGFSLTELRIHLQGGPKTWVPADVGHDGDCNCDDCRDPWAGLER